MKCKAKRCNLESRHKGSCDEVGPYAINAAINKVRLTGDTKKVVPESVQPVVRSSPKQAGVSAGAVQVVRVEQGAASSVTPNRRKRDDYNEYMREYMKKRRSGFIGIAYG